MKNILILSAEYPPNGGGAGIVAQQLFEDSHKDANHFEFIVNLPMKFHIQKFFFEFFFHYQLNSFNLNEFDLIVLNDTRSILYASHFFSKFNLSKTICIVHGKNYSDYFSENISFINNIRFYSNSYNTVLDGCKRILAVSDFIKKDLLKSYEFLSEDKIITSYCGIDKNFLAEAVNQKRVKPNQIKLLSVSRIISSKGYETKLNIFNNLISEGVDVIWDIVGDGPFLEQLNDLVSKLNLNERVKLLGKMPRDNLKALYSEYDIFWLLPNNDEAFGLVYLEAQASGLTAIGSNFGGIKEAINLSTGIVSNDADIIFNFIKNFIRNYNVEIENISFSSKFKSTNFIKSIVNESE